MLPDPPMGTPTSVCNGMRKPKLGGALVLTVKLKLPVAVADPADPLRARLYVPAAIELAAWRCMVVPLGGSATLEVVEVIPVGKLPRVSVPLPLILTSEGSTVIEKLLSEKTVVP
jgi:hypothetical protein